MPTEIVDIYNLVNDSQNARIHPESNRRAIRASLGRFGAGRSIVLDSDNVVRAGNGTIDAARLEGFREVIIVDPEPGQLVAVRRSDWSKSQASAYAIADNRTGETSEWADETLLAALSGLSDDDKNATGFSEIEIAAMLEASASRRAGESDGKIESSQVVPSQATILDPDPIPVDRHAELVAKWRTASGQLWDIPSLTVSGRSHRVFCGDCTLDAVELVMGGMLANGVCTSPPYAEQRKRQYGGVSANDYAQWFSDVQANVRAILRPNGSFFVNIKEHSVDGQRHLYVKKLVVTMVEQWDWKFVDEFIWKRPGVPGRWPNRLKNQFEPIFHFAINTDIKMRPENVAYLSDNVPVSSDCQNRSDGGMLLSEGTTRGEGMAFPGNVLECAAEKGLSALHSAPFPVPIPTFFVKAFSDPGDLWFDPFMGSGTTILACENEGRIAYGTELLPEHLAVILERCSQKGMTPSLLG